LCVPEAHLDYSDDLLIITGCEVNDFSRKKSEIVTIDQHKQFEGASAL